VVVGPKREQVTGEIGGLLVLVFLISYMWLFIDLLILRLLCVFLMATIKIFVINLFFIVPIHALHYTLKSHTYLLTPWSRVLLEKLTSKLCS
jgi:hypothetical protein